LSPESKSKKFNFKGKLSILSKLILSSGLKLEKFNFILSIGKLSILSKLILSLKLEKYDFIIGKLSILSKLILSAELKSKKFDIILGKLFILSKLILSLLKSIKFCLNLLFLHLIKTIPLPPFEPDSLIEPPPAPPPPVPSIPSVIFFSL
jgi:hypothetical protein